MIAQYIKYRLKAKGIQSLHSPFMFEFYKQYRRNKKDDSIGKLERVFKEVSADNRTIDAAGFGAGSRKKGTVLSVKDIANRAGMQKSELPLIRTICAQFESPTIIELGTNLGLGTAALAYFGNEASITTFEGNTDLLAYAKSLHARNGFNNISYVAGDIHKTLLPALKGKQIDIAYIDADHRYEATCSFFNNLRPLMKEQSVIVFDDIYWSEGMTRAWHEIKLDESVQVSVDMFHKGLLFIDSKLSKQHYVLRY